MRKLRNLVAAALVCGSLVGGCGSDGDTDISAIQLALEDCSQSTMVSMMQALFAIVTIPDVIAGEDPFPGFDVDVVLSVDPLDPPNTWDFAVTVDTNANGIPDTTVVGSITFSDDPTDGLAPLSTLDISFTVQNSVIAGASDSGTVTGSGDLFATLGASSDDVAITGTISLTDTAGDGCEATLTFPEATPLNLDFGDALPEQLAANVGLFEIFGTIEAFIESLGHELDATMMLVNGDQTVSVDGTIDGIAVDFDFELLPSDEVMNQLFGCLIASAQWVTIFESVYDQVKDTALGGPPPAGIIVAPTSDPDVFAYTVDLLLFDPTTFTLGTITGEATLVFPVTSGLAGVVVLPSEVTFTWTISGATFTGGQASNGQNAAGRPFRLRLDETGALLSFSGAGTITTTFPAVAGLVVPADCTMTFDILESDPFAADESDGTVILTVQVGADTLVAIIDIAEQEIVTTVNGIPIPFFL